jgi:hypothetical protein
MGSTRAALSFLGGGESERLWAAHGVNAALSK